MATTSSNTVIISATSTRAGAYSITTPVVNGVSFSGSGSFTGVGTQSIILTASGTPTTAGQFSYNTIASAGGSNCNFSLGYAPPTFPFQFITATVGGVSKTFNTNIYAYFDVASSRFILNGENPAGTEIFDIAIGFSGGVLPAGTYNVAGMGSLEVGYYTNIPNTITYVAQTGIINPTPTFSVTLDNTITSTTHTTVTGSFSGAVKNASGNIIQITNGLFSVNL